MILPSQAMLTADLQALIDRWVDGDVTLSMCLFKNNWTEACAPVIAAFTEADFTGYARKQLLPGDWATITYAAGVATTVQPVQTWTATGGAVTNTVYGYYVFESADTTTLLWAEKNPAGATSITTAGNQYFVLPRYQRATWDLIPCPVS